MERRDDPNAGLVVAWGIVGTIFVFVIIVGLQAFFHAAQDQEEGRKVRGQVPEERARLVASQQERLNSYRWIDEANGITAIPIDRAMEIVVREMRSRGGTVRGTGGSR